MKKKIFVLLPDGVGLRNFAFTSFYEIGLNSNFDITYWNNTPFDLQELGFNEIKIEGAKQHRLTDIYKNARKRIELNISANKFNDPVYHTYKFPYNNKGYANKVKSLSTKIITKFGSTEKGLKKVRGRIKSLERQTDSFKNCLSVLKKEKPSLVFCTNQRPITAVAPILAAQKLGIPTATFIFSWDNLPKATMVVETDYYFVWSEHMKNELLQYYPYVNEKQIVVTGTTQFESHYNKTILEDKAQFFKTHNLETNKEYICFSGDDVTTSPDDPVYLEDIAKAVSELNNEGYNIGVLFRRCPVDFSGRHSDVIKRYSDIIRVVEPAWKKIGGSWNAVLPTKEDLILQANTINNTFGVINIASSMVFDYVAYNKPCLYIDYNPPVKSVSYWDVHKIYDYVHFRSMPTKNSVLWAKNSSDLKPLILKMFNGSGEVVQNAADWFKIITLPHPSKSSENIWNAIKNIVE